MTVIKDYSDIIYNMMVIYEPEIPHGHAGIFSS